MTRSPSIIRFFGSILLLLMFSISSYAASISYSYTGTWSNYFNGVFGSTYTATVIFDNGGTEIANQVFTQSDLVSARLVSGSYDQTMLPSDITSWSVDFVSDGSGALGSGWFNAVNGDHNWHFDNAWADENFVETSAGDAGYFDSHVSNIGQLVGAPSSTPVPTMSAYGLILTILGLLVVASRRLPTSVKRR